MTATAGKVTESTFEVTLYTSITHTQQKKASSKAAFNKTAIKGVEYGLTERP